MPGNKRSTPVATVVCPVIGCGERVPVYRYEVRTKDENKKESRRRFAGKLYCRCKTDGKLDCNEYILNSESIEWLNEKQKAESVPPVEVPENIAPAPVLESTKIAPRPVNNQSQQSSHKRKTGWGFYPA